MTIICISSSSSSRCPCRYQCRYRFCARSRGRRRRRRLGMAMDIPIRMRARCIWSSMGVRMARMSVMGVGADRLGLRMREKGRDEILHELG